MIRDEAWSRNIKKSCMPGVLPGEEHADMGCSGLCIRSI